MTEQEKSELAPGKEPHLFINQLWEAIQNVVILRKSRGEAPLDLDDPRERGLLILAVLAANVRQEGRMGADHRWWDIAARVSWRAPDVQATMDDRRLQHERRGRPQRPEPGPGDLK